MEKGGIYPVQEEAKADAMNLSLTATLFGAFVLFLVGGTILFLSLIKLKEIKEEKEGLELVKEDYLEIGETYIEIKEEGINTDKKQYIPLAIYFVLMTLLVVSSY